MMTIHTKNTYLYAQQWSYIYFHIKGILQAKVLTKCMSNTRRGTWK